MDAMVSGHDDPAVSLFAAGGPWNCETSWEPQPKRGHSKRYWDLAILGYGDVSPLSVGATRRAHPRRPRAAALQGAVLSAQQSVRSARSTWVEPTLLHTLLAGRSR